MKSNLFVPDKSNGLFNSRIEFNDSIIKMRVFRGSKPDSVEIRDN